MMNWLVLRMAIRYCKTASSIPVWCAYKNMLNLVTVSSPLSYISLFTVLHPVAHLSIHVQSSMSEVDRTCRICRGEATESQPLIHPCKCRGSIKYIHQDCLMEWLNHTNKSTKQCDICNTPYRFRTIYDPNMPKRVPLKDLWNKMLQSLGSWLFRRASILLYSACALQVPIFWKFVGRILTYTIDGRLPSPHFSLLHALLYGAYNLRSRSGHLLTGPEATMYDKAESFLLNTFASGLVHVVIFLIVLVVIFIEHEWVVREEGYTKLLLRQIGKEPRTKLADLLTLLLLGGDENDASREVMINRALEDLRNVPDVHRNEAELRRALAERVFDDYLAPRDANALLEIQHPEGILPHPTVNDDSESEEEEVHNLHQDDDAAVRQDEDANDNVGNNIAHNLLDFDDEDETAEELERRQNLAEDEMAAAEAANNNGDLLEIFGIRLNLVMPIQLMIVADFVVVLFLFNAYLIPHMLGNLAVSAFTFVVMDVFRYIFQPLLPFLPLSKMNSLLMFFLQRLRTNESLSTVYYMTSEILVLPLYNFLKDVCSSDNDQPPTSVERLLFLGLGYAIICTAVNQFMNALVSGKKPVMGTSRKVYKFLFKVVATAKVFGIFAIEIVLFPIFCGFLLDFCMNPLFTLNLVSHTESGTVYNMLFTTSHLLTQHTYVRAFLYWLWGTSYMFLIALYVGMIRSNILRPGVLFFIKSPEDPNARLIHDAVVKPFLLQVLRIFLSAKVYTAFIVLGIGSTTWGLRFLVSPPSAEKAVLFPIRLQDVAMIFVPLSLGHKIKPLLANRWNDFWKWSFSMLCSRLRLSHFLLGVPVPEERGHVLYRNILQTFLGLAVPDFSRPLSYSEAMRVFQEHPEVKACFVPDGNFIRAPGSDDNSHKFLRSLFVPVTKSDQLLSPAEEVLTDEETDWWDEDIQYEDTYTVVYTPPYLKIRCIVLVIMVCLFGALLSVFLGIIALLLGRPVVVVATKTGSFFFPKFVSNNIDWSFADCSSLSVGITIELLIVTFISAQQDGFAVADLFAERQQHAVGRVLDAGMRGAGYAILNMLSESIEQAIDVYIHMTYISLLERYFFGTSLAGSGRVVTWRGVLLHCAFLPWTYGHKISNVFKLFTNVNERTSYHKLRFLRHVGICSFFLLDRYYRASQIRNGVVLTDREDIMLKGLTLAMVVLTQSALYLSSLLTSLLKQIRDEKYVRGTAIENLDGTEDN